MMSDRLQKAINDYWENDECDVDVANYIIHTAERQKQASGTHPQESGENGMTDKLNDIKEQWKQHGEEVGIAKSVNGAFYVMESQDVKDVEWLISELEAKEREIEKLKINRFFEDYKTERYNRIRITQENKRLREALEEIEKGENTKLDFTGESNSEALEVAKQALTGEVD
jgi:hypothetical protein